MKFPEVVQRADNGSMVSVSRVASSLTSVALALSGVTFGALMLVACGETGDKPPADVAPSATLGTDSNVPDTLSSQTLAPGTPSGTVESVAPLAPSSGSQVSPSNVVPSVTPTGATTETTSTPTGAITDTSSVPTGTNTTSTPTETDTTSTSSVDETSGNSSQDPGQEPLEGVGDLAKLPCGARYTALGGGGWRFCLRLDDGGGACVKSAGSAEFERVTLTGGGALDNVTQITGAGDERAILVVTASGALLAGVPPSEVNATPIVASGVVNVTGGLNPRVALIREGSGFGILSWKGTDQPAPLTLPGGANPVQVAANYGLACALDTQGDVYCWDMGGNHQVPGVNASPAKMDFAAPSRMVTVGQNSVCALTFDGVIQCAAHYYSSPWLPAKSENGQPTLDASNYEPARDISAGYHQGIIVKDDGTAYYFGDNSAQANDHGKLFTGATDVVASGGDRGNACVMTRGGDVYCWSGGSSVRATLAGQPLKAATASCSP